MLKNYLKIALRNLVKYKSYSIINISGFAVSIAGAVLIFLYVYDEIQYDAFHENADNIYRVVFNREQSGSENGKSFAQVPAPVGPLLKDEFPEVSQAVRIWPWGNPIVEYGQEKHAEDNLFFADSGIFSTFSFDLLQGDAGTVLSDPNTVVVNERIAAKYFGDTNPVGKILRYENNRDLMVTGVMKNIPRNSHLQGDFFVSMSTLEIIQGTEHFNRWSGNNFATYVQLNTDQGIPSINGKISAFLKQHRQTNIQSEVSFSLQPLREIYLYSELDVDFVRSGNITYVYIFSACGILLILVAGFNFINITTAASLNRIKEIGVRKALGARKRNFIAQFLGESILIACISAVTALMIVFFVLPDFNNFTGKELTLSVLFKSSFIAVFFSFVITLGLISGGLPARYFIASLRSGSSEIHSSAQSKSKIRQSMVIAQFTISLVLIMGIVAVNSQLNYIQEKDLGYDKNLVIILPGSSALRSSFTTIRSELLRYPDIQAVTASSHLLSAKSANNTLTASIADPNAGNPKDMNLHFFYVEKNFVESMKMDLTAGESYAKDYSDDAIPEFIINEAAVRAIGWADPRDAIGRPFTIKNWKTGKIVGVAKDFHFESMYEEIAPFVFFLAPFYNNVLVRADAENLPRTLSFLEDRWKQLRPDYPFTYSFLDERLHRIYANEQKVAAIFGFFGSLTLSIACLGLFGLASFSMRQRLKEISVRKILGAKLSGIIMLLSKEFAVLVGIAIVIASPLAYTGIERWLQNFAYRIELGWFMFLLVAICMFGLAFIAILYHSISVGLTNPVKILRRN